MRFVRPASAVPLAVLCALLCACEGSDDPAGGTGSGVGQGASGGAAGNGAFGIGARAGNAGAAGKSGSAGAAGATAGAGGASGTAGKGGTAGKSGASGAGGKSGSAGAAGKGGAAGKAGAGGTAGTTAGTSGAAGALGGGAGGLAGQAGSNAGQGGEAGGSDAGAAGTNAGAAGEGGAAGDAGAAGDGGTSGAAGDGGAAGEGGNGGDAGNGGIGGGGNGGAGGGLPTCNESEKLCGTQCVLRDDPAYGCTESGCDACALFGATATTCAAGSCAVATCAAGFADCDGAAANGCEVNLPTSADHCGQCGRPCALADATAKCGGGLCVIDSCDADHLDCDGKASNGCEKAILGDPQNCGGCGIVCAGEVGQVGVCNNGVCGLSSCQPPFADCDLDAAHTCEVDMRSDPNACGSCGRKCNLPHATAGCAASACTIAACQPPFLDCDGDPSNGCEVDGSASNSHCGTCGAVCAVAGGISACQSGVCTFVSCNGNTADLDENGANGCEYTCPVSPRQPETCNGLDDDCDGVADDGNPGAGASCVSSGLGICAAGTTACTSGALVCNQSVTAKPETCNGFDDDCDGTTDEGNPGGGGGCVTGQPGVCAAGTLTCSGGALGCVQNTASSAETCNGLDDDCDGSTDEGNPGGGAACSTGNLGVCAAGTRTCTGGALACAQNVTAGAETCNGKDDDCDGSTDEGNPGGGIPCSTGQAGVCAAGTTACTVGVIACNQNVAASPEIPNGLDDNCDGNVDEGLGFASCLEIHQANGSLPSGTYSIDPDLTGPAPSVSVYCDMASDGGGYTWQAFSDPSLRNDSRAYVTYCANKGLEIIVRKSRAHATALYTWYGNKNPPLVNIVPNGVPIGGGLQNWHGVCRGQPCPFWMNDTNGDIGCGTSIEPSGDVNVDSRLWLRPQACGVEGNWNDSFYFVAITGSVICSTNDKEAFVTPQ